MSHNHQLRIVISGDLHSVNTLFTENQNIIEGCHFVSVSFLKTQACMSGRGRLETIRLSSCRTTRNVSCGELSFTSVPGRNVFWSFCSDKNGKFKLDMILT